MKRCIRCGIEKQYFEFYTHKETRDKLRTICKDCEKIYAKKWTQNNREKHKISVKKWIQKNLYRHKLLSKLRRERWLLKLSKQEKEKLKPSREKIRLYNTNYRNKISKKLNNIPFGTIKQFGINTSKYIFKKYNNKCSICKKREKLVIHHIDGVGFSNYKKLNTEVNNNLDNLLLVCRVCHMLIHKNLPLLRKN